MTTYFDRKSRPSRPPERTTYEVTDDLLDVLASTTVPERLRPLARSLGAGSALSSPHLLLHDLVNLYDSPSLYRSVSGPATAALLGGSISAEGELQATGVAFSVSRGLAGFVTFAIPAALLVPGGGFYLAYRLYQLVRDVASVRSYARISRAAPHVAIAVAASDEEITRDEARLLRDLLRGRVGSPRQRHEILESELDPLQHPRDAFEALRTLELEPSDWEALLSIAVATAHADDDYSGEERELIARFRQLTDFGEEEFAQMAADAEEDHMLRSHLGEAMVRACYAIGCGEAAELADDATPLMDILMCAAVPSDVERATLADELLDSDGDTAPSRQTLLEDASAERPGIFRRVAGARSEQTERVREFGKTLALFLATLEQWRGWVVPGCRERLVAIGERYGLDEKQLTRWLRRAHRNVEAQRKEWIAPRPWEAVDERDLERRSRTGQPPKPAFDVTGLAGGRFLFRRGDSGWEWRSSDVEFDTFVRRTLSVEVTDVIVQTDDTTYELLSVTIEAHESEIRVRRLEAE